MDVPPAPLPDDAHSASLPRRDEIEETERSATDVWRNVTRFVGGAAAAATTYIGGGGLASLNDECADPSSSEEELNRLYALELDWLASVREGDNVDINTRYHDASTSESYVWKLARVYKIEWKTTTVHEVARAKAVLPGSIPDHELREVQQLFPMPGSTSEDLVQEDTELLLGLLMRALDDGLFHRQPCATEALLNV